MIMYCLWASSSVTVTQMKRRYFLGSEIIINMGSSLKQLVNDNRHVMNIGNV